jgi:cellulose synthase/poly-beta-1,6-N-acetylglucosamine synthase-like glycosyltransferase
MAPIISFFTILFFTSVFLILYTYVIFPSILGLLTSGKKLNVKSEGGMELPFVSVIISVYNEESVIEEKLKSILNSDYPEDRLEIIVGSDASDDGTAAIVEKFAGAHRTIKLYEFTDRRGKPSVINDLVEKSSHAIIILTDANVFFEKKTIKNLVRHFDNPETGLVGANILNVGMKPDGISIQEKSYIERENLIKYREGVLWGCMMGPFGGCYALRKELFEKVPAGFLVDDFYISMKIIEKKYHCVNELEAVCYEDVSNDIKQEYKRKSRISAGNFQNLVLFSKFLLRPFTPAGFCFISHKFLRWVTPFLIILTLISLVILSGTNVVFSVLLIGEILLLLAPIIDFLFRKFGIHLKLLRFIAYFSYMNLALMKGFFRYMKGIESGVWAPTKRN